MSDITDTGANKQYKKLFYRGAVYCLGLFILSFGTSLSVCSRLGVSSGSAFPYVISQISGLTLGNSVTIIFWSFIFLQWLLLRRGFRIKNLLQVAVSVLFGYFMDFWGFALNTFVFSSYVARLLLLMVSILFVGLGITLFILPKIIVMPIEGLAGAMAQKFKFPFHTSKTIVDCASVGLGIIISFVFLHTLVGIREGTILSALLVGKVIKFFTKRIELYATSLLF